jgi:hypothetical protein
MRRRSGSSDGHHDDADWHHADPFAETAQIPKGPDAKHDMEGILELDPAMDVLNPEFAGVHLC